MSVSRLEHITPIAVEQMGDLAAFIEAGKPIDLLIMPDETHGSPGIWSGYGWDAVQSYFCEHLLPDVEEARAPGRLDQSSMAVLHGRQSLSRCPCAARPTLGVGPLRVLPNHRGGCRLATVSVGNDVAC
jgi:hypothetical protein